MSPEEFVCFETVKPDENRHIIVTNNLNATDAHGEMSHVWLTNFYTWSKGCGCFVTFADDDSMVIGLTHWKYA